MGDKFSVVFLWSWPLACLMHEGTDFHGSACKFGDVDVLRRFHGRYGRVGSKLVRAHVETQRVRIALESLPRYAPEIYPVECIWGYRKRHAMPNYCGTDLQDVVC